MNSIAMAKSFRSLCAAGRRLVAFLLIAILWPAAPLLSQISAAPGPQKLQIVILDGEDAINNIRERTAREPIVQVEDENHKPVAGALLLFTIQGGPNGAGASFNGLNTLSVTTDAEGKATAHGLTPNATQGSYSIAVSATVGTIVATTIIKQTNAGGGGGGGGNNAATTSSGSSTSTGTATAAGTSTAGGTSTAAGSSTAGGTSTAAGTSTATATGARSTSSSSSSSSSSGASGSSASSGSSGITGVATATLKRGGRLQGLLKSPWLFSAVGAVAVTVAVRTTVINGRGPTSITPGNGTVGAP